MSNKLLWKKLPRSYSFSSGSRSTDGPKYLQPGSSPSRASDATGDRGSQFANTKPGPTRGPTTGLPSIFASPSHLSPSYGASRIVGTTVDPSTNHEQCLVQNKRAKAVPISTRDILQHVSAAELERFDCDQAEQQKQREELDRRERIALREVKRPRGRPPKAKYLLGTQQESLSSAASSTSGTKAHFSSGPQELPILQAGRRRARAASRQTS